MATQPITFDTITTYPNDLILYCILITGFDETNTGVITSAISLFQSNDVEYIRLTELLNAAPFNGVDKSLTEIVWYIRYLALFCFVYATLDDVSMGGRVNKNIAGLRMSKVVAPGWASCLLEYLNPTSVPAPRHYLGIRSHRDKVINTNDIIATALTNKYISNGSDQFKLLNF